MNRFCQWQRLLAEYPVIETLVQPLIEKKKDPTKSRMRIQLRIEEYEALLGHVQNERIEIRDYRSMPHPPGSYVLQPYAIPRSVWDVSDELLVSAIKPNNCVKYLCEGKVCYGLIRQIYEFCNAYDKWETVLIVNPIINLYPKDLESPSKFFRFLLFLLKCVVGQIDPEFIVLSTQQVKSVAAYCLLPDTIFGIDEGGIILRPCDYNATLDTK